MSCWPYWSSRWIYNRNCTNVSLLTTPSSV